MNPKKKCWNRCSNFTVFIKNIWTVLTFSLNFKYILLKPCQSFAHWLSDWCSVINPHLIIEALHNILGKTILQDKVSANTASWFPKCYKKLDRSQNMYSMLWQKLTILPGKLILCKKHLKKGYFCVHKSDLPDFGRIWTPNSWLQVNFWGGPENFGV